MSARALPGESLESRVLRAIEEVRPGLQHDGGDLSFVAIKGEVVTIRLEGACAGCAMAPTTLLSFITERVRYHAPEIRRVIAG